MVGPVTATDAAEAAALRKALRSMVLGMGISFVASSETLIRNVELR
jgi:hypothetical protein